MNSHDEKMDGNLGMVTGGPVHAQRAFDVKKFGVLGDGNTNEARSGESPGKIQDLFFEDVHINIKKITGLPGGIYERRPSAEKSLVKGNTSGFYLYSATSVVIKNSSVRWCGHLPNYCKYAIDSNEVAGFTDVAAAP